MEETKELTIQSPGGEAPEKRGNTRAKRALDILCAVSGGFFVLVYLPYFFWHLVKGHPVDVVVALLVFSGVLVPFLLRRLLRKGLKKAYIPLKIVWCVFMCFYMMTFSAFCVFLTVHKDAVGQGSGQPVVIVFGCQIRGEEWLSIELQSRLDTAAEVLSEYPEALCVLSGGKGKDEPVSEAAAMKKYLVEKKNIDESRLLLEEFSTDTDENVRLSLETLRGAGIDPKKCSFICVSSSFHTPRIHLLFARQGDYDCATVSAPTPYFINRFVYTVREYMSYVFLLLFG